MGGLIGMQLAAAAQSPVRRLILNDVGPFIPKAALARIGDYVGKDPHFASLDELEAHLRKIHAPFGPMTDQDWRHLALQGYRRRENGGFGLAYDPGHCRRSRCSRRSRMSISGRSGTRSPVRYWCCTA